MFYNMNFILAFIFIYFNFSLCVKKERYQRLVTKTLGSIQTTFNDNSITLYNTNGDSLLRFYNLRLINPALSKMSYEYDETMPLYVTAKNVIITFVTQKTMLDIGVLLMTITTSLFGIALVQAVQIPFIYKLRTRKGKNSFDNSFCNFCFVHNWSFWYAENCR